jgi:hypothetical protein
MRREFQENSRYLLQRRQPSTNLHNNHHKMNSNNDFAGLPATERLTRKVREELLALPYSAFLLVVARLLERQGYRQVRLLGRKEFVGRNRSGGWDLEATAPRQQAMSAGQAGPRCIIQVKQFDKLTVQQRTVDELRGCILRSGAGLGILITTSRFSPVAQEAAQTSSLAPIVLLSGKELLSLLIQQRLGVFQKPNSKWAVDLEFFRSIREVEPGNVWEAGAKGAVKRDRGQHLLSYVSSSAITNYLPKDNHLPENRQSLSFTPSKSQVMHFSIMLSAEPGCGSEPGTKRNKQS